MPDAKMHAEEIDIDAGLVRRLLAAQFPHWADLPVRAVKGGGTEHAIYRVGADLAVRLPRLAGGAAGMDKEHRWLPAMAPLLPLPIPVPVATGRPAEGYPEHWSVYRWLDGEPAWPVTEPAALVGDLARFVRALHRVDLDGGPPCYRGGPLAARDAAVRRAIGELRGSVDVDEVTSRWEAALRAPAWDGPPVWAHGDLLPANLLTRDGRLSAVIDFGCVGVGDPACDAMPAWTLLDAPGRDRYRAEVGYDDATWDRGRGWALCFAVVALPYYRTTNPVLAGTARRTIDAVLADPWR